MGAEVYFAMPDDGPRRPVSDFVRLLTAAGYACREEPDEWGHWVVFEGMESALNFSLDDGTATFATLDMVGSDPDEFFAAVERVFAEAGWTAGP